MPIGTLIRKIHRQLMPEVSAPPTSGPIATAPPAVPPQALSAIPRSRPRYLCASRASEVANMAAPPMPWTARNAIRNADDCARPHSSELAQKIASPARKTFRAPDRSPSEPAMSSSAASEIA